MIIELAIAVLLIPLLAFVIQIFLGSRLPRGGDWVSTAAMFLSLLCSAIIFSQMLGNFDPDFKREWAFRWAVVGQRTFEIQVVIDNVTAVMLVVVSLVSSLVHLYSIAYMHGDPRYSRYFAYLSLFSFSMLGLVLTDHLLVIYIFWELVGVSSYLLIGFWFERESAYKAAIKAFLTTRIGDVGMFIGILIFYFTLGTFKLSEIGQGVDVGLIKGGLLTAAGLCLFAGAVGKSAQFPLHVWLPDAMEGPTPVSALIHAATMVIAGVYLVVRIFFILTPEAMLTIAYIGGFTALFAATIALVQNDIKRVLAYSTISQLGYMMLALGVGAYTAGFFHLTTQAAIKAGLFLGSGSVIHAMHHALHEVGSHDDPQDMRNMGGLRKKMPLTFWAFMLSTLAISGVPLTSGFLSKDAILNGSLAFALESPGHFLLPVFGFGAALLTAFYMFRLVFKTFFGQFRLSAAFEHVHESPGVMVIPLVVLAVLSTFIFFSANPISAEEGWFYHLIHKPDQLALVSHEEVHHEEGAAHLYGIILSLGLASLGILLSFLTYHRKVISAGAWARRFALLYKALVNKWYMDDLYGATVIKPSIDMSRAIGSFDLKVVDGAVNGVGRLAVFISWMSGFFDNWVVDGMVNGVGLLTRAFAQGVRGLQTGKVQSYLALTVVGIILIIVIRFLI